MKLNEVELAGALNFNEAGYSEESAITRVVTDFYSSSLNNCADIFAGKSNG